MSTTATATAIPIPDLGQPASSEESPDYLETSPSSQSLVSAYSSAKLNDAPLYADAGAGPTPKTLPPVGMSLDSLSSIDTSSSQLEGGHSSDDHSVETVPLAGGGTLSVDKHADNASVAMHGQILHHFSAINSKKKKIFDSDFGDEGTGSALDTPLIGKTCKYDGAKGVLFCTATGFYFSGKSLFKKSKIAIRYSQVSQIEKRTVGLINSITVILADTSDRVIFSHFSNRDEFFVSLGAILSGAYTQADDSALSDSTSFDESINDNDTDSLQRGAPGSVSDATGEFLSPQPSMSMQSGVSHESSPIPVRPRSDAPLRPSQISTSPSRRSRKKTGGDVASIGSSSLPPSSPLSHSPGGALAGGPAILAGHHAPSSASTADVSVLRLISGVERRRRSDSILANLPPKLADTGSSLSASDIALQSPGRMSDAGAPGAGAGISPGAGLSVASPALADAGTGAGPLSPHVPVTPAGSASAPAAASQAPELAAAPTAMDPKKAAMLAVYASLNGQEPSVTLEGTEIVSSLVPGAFDDVFASVFDMTDDVFLSFHRRCRNTGITAHGQAADFTGDGPWNPSREAVGGTRDIQYSIPINIPMTSKTSTPCFETQIIYKYEPAYICVETITRTPEVPFGECFAIHCKYYFIGRTPGESRFVGTAQAKFSRSTMFRSKIEKTSMDQIKVTMNYLLDSIRDKFQSRDSTGAAGLLSAGAAAGSGTAGTHAGGAGAAAGAAGGAAGTAGAKGLGADGSAADSAAANNRGLVAGLAGGLLSVVTGALGTVGGLFSAVSGAASGSGSPGGQPAPGQKGHPHGVAYGRGGSGMHLTANGGQAVNYQAPGAAGYQLTCRSFLVALLLAVVMMFCTAFLSVEVYQRLRAPQPTNFAVLDEYSRLLNEKTEAELLLWHIGYLQQGRADVKVDVQLKALRESMERISFPSASGGPGLPDQKEGRGGVGRRTSAPPPPSSPPRPDAVGG